MEHNKVTRAVTHDGYNAIYVMTGNGCGLIQYLDHIQMLSGYKLFSVNAGYCKSHKGTLWYYVVAQDKKEAKAKLNQTLTWLAVYAAKEVIDKSEIEDVLSHPCKRIIL